MERLTGLEWTSGALADLDRFAAFLAQHHPNLANRVAAEIIAKAQMLAEFPMLGRPIAGRPEYREVILQVLNARYAFRYRYDGKRLTILRIFHGREQR